MSKVLYIKANIKNEGESRTFKVSDSFVEEYMKNNPQDEDSKKHPVLKYAYQFAEADKNIIKSIEKTVRLS